MLNVDQTAKLTKPLAGSGFCAKIYDFSDKSYNLSITLSTMP
jgi:hypothetical protein